MSTILETIQLNSNERPKYTRYELARLVQDERKERRLSVEEVASMYNVTSSYWESIEGASRLFNSKIYNIISAFLNISVEELLSKEQDDISLLSFRTKNEDEKEIQEVFQVANRIFQELVIQEKISV